MTAVLLWLRGYGCAPRSPGVYRDDAVMEDAAARLTALELFKAVYCGATPDEQPAPASDQFAVAWVWDEAGQTLPIFPGSRLNQRSGVFGVAIEVRHNDPIERRRRMSRLESDACNALENQPLSNACYPTTVKMERRGRDHAVNHPSARSILVGTYRFPVGGSAARDNSDRESDWR